jgi:hypothetical protein
MTLVAAAALAWATLRGRPGLVPAMALATMLLLYPVLVHVVAPGGRARAERSRRGGRSSPPPARPRCSRSRPWRRRSFFYLRAPVVWTEDTRLVRELFAA